MYFRTNELKQKKMKRILHTLAAVFFTAFTIQAQNISLASRVVSVEWYSNERKLAATTITNNATDPADSLFSWQIIEYNLVSGWDFSFCDNQECYYGLSLGSTKNFTLRKGETGPLQGDFIFNDIGGNGNVRVVIKSLSNSSMIDTFSMIAKGWATGVNDIKKTNTISFYPNPAKDIITLKQKGNKTIDISIYNILGSIVKNITLNPGENSISIGDLQKGMYFIRYMENGNLVSKPFTKIE